MEPTRASPLTILVVDDEPNIRDLLIGYLRHAGYEVATAADGLAALAEAERVRPVLVVLDLMLPGLDGWEVCRRLRERWDVPILMLTARAEEHDRLIGLGLGADDYVTKPFSPREVVARVKAILRRAGYEGQPLQHGCLVLDAVARKVTVDGRPIALTAQEFDLLHTLLRHPGRVFTREELLSYCWEIGFEGVDRVVDVHIGKLRAKLGDDPARPHFIHTVRGVGYRLGGEG
jgi:two-component system alkaline phosphatase synthesis response regulator PhoP